MDLLSLWDSFRGNSIHFLISFCFLWKTPEAQTFFFLFGLAKAQFPTACPSNSNAYAPWAISSYIDSLFNEALHASVL